MAMHGVQQQKMGSDPSQWVITIADDRAPGKSVLLVEAGAFATEAEALACADDLNRKQADR